MNYNVTIETLVDFYDTLYSAPPRLDREHTTPQVVTANLLAALDNPQQAFRSILITGSKGKGSSALMLKALLNSAGERVGLFSSPHLFDYRERIVIDSDMIDSLTLLRLARRVFAAANALTLNHSDEFPRFFEITTAIAYLYFAEYQVDFAVIETGIGAMTDATNQHAHQLSVLTNIELEHSDIFGTLENIAKEKSGVMRENTPLILGDLPETIDQIIINHAAELQAPVTRFKSNFILNNNGFYPVKVGEKFWITDSPLRAKNAWLALTALNKLYVELSDTEKVEALNQVKLPAREEIISKTPFVIIDGAHTEKSAMHLANYVQKSVTFPVRNKTLLLSFSAEKNILPVLSAFPDADTIVLTRATTTRSIQPDTIVAQVKQATNTKIIVIENPLTALGKTLKKLKANDVLVITGSVYLAGLLSQQFNR